ncbi:MAG: phenylalanine--tRNA ligase subunit alpha, partial [Anaerotignum sp.]
MKDKLKLIQEKALAAFQEAKEIKDVDELKVKFLGKKGELTAILKEMGKLSAEERPIIGQMANEVRQ